MKLRLYILHLIFLVNKSNRCIVLPMTVVLMSSLGRALTGTAGSAKAPAWFPLLTPFHPSTIFNSTMKMYYRAVTSQE